MSSRACGIAGTTTPSSWIKRRVFSATRDKVHRLDHDGPYFKVAGPLNMPRSAAGLSGSDPGRRVGRGRAFAASVAEVIFAVHQDIDARDYFAAVKDPAVRLGGTRPSEDHARRLRPIIGGTQREAGSSSEICSARRLPRSVRSSSNALAAPPRMSGYPTSMGRCPICRPTAGSRGTPSLGRASHGATA